MLKIKLVTVILISMLSSSLFAEEFAFVKGERAAFDMKRDKTSKAQTVIDMAELKQGMIVADVLGGGGYYSELIGKEVGTSGKVYLHNNKAYMPWIEKELVARLKGDRLSNVIRHDREADNLDFAPESLDVIFFVLGYHDLYHVADGWKIDKDDFLSQLTKALKSNGKLIIIDHSAVDGSNTKYSQKLHRIDKQFVKTELTEKGFTFIKESNLLANMEDTRLITPFKPEIRRNTDRFILIFKK